MGNLNTLVSPPRSSSLNASQNTSRSPSPQSWEASTRASSTSTEPASSGENLKVEIRSNSVSSPTSPSTSNSKKFFKKFGNKIDRIIKPASPQSTKPLDTTLQSKPEPEVVTSPESVTVTNFAITQNYSPEPVATSTEVNNVKKDVPENDADSKDVKSTNGTKEATDSANTTETQETDEVNAEEKKNKFDKFGIKLSNVSRFIVRSSSAVVEKLKEEFDELDRRMYPDEVIESQESQEIDKVEREVVTTSEVSEQSKREELLGKPEETSPTKDSKDQAVNGGAKGAFAEVGEALNERGEKLNDLSDKVADLATASDTFAALAKQLAEKEANRKWYQW